MLLPLPDELIERYLGHGEQKIHSDHPSFRAFMVKNGLLLSVFMVLVALFLGVTFKGPLLVALVIGLLATGMGVALFLRRLNEAYTSYVITDVRIIVLRGVFARKMHSIPWARVTDLSMEQSFAGRLFGFATVHIESANEDSGLRDLIGVSDPMRFHGYLIDMVVAKQGTLLVESGERPATGGLFNRLRRARNRRLDGSGRRFGRRPADPRVGDLAGEDETVDAAAAAGSVADDSAGPPGRGAPPGDATVVTWAERAPAPSESGRPYYADHRQVIVGMPSTDEAPAPASKATLAPADVSGRQRRRSDTDVSAVADSLGDDDDLPWSDGP